MGFSLGRKQPRLLFGHLRFTGGTALCGFPSQEKWDSMHDKHVERWGEQPLWDESQWTASEPVWVRSDAVDGDGRCGE